MFFFENSSCADVGNIIELKGIEKKPRVYSHDDGIGDGEEKPDQTDPVFRGFPVIGMGG